MLVSLAAFVIFYLMTVFALSWGTSALGYTREQFLLMQLFGDPVLRADDSDLRGARRARPPAHADVGQRRRSRVFGLVLAPLFAPGTSAPLLTMVIGHVARRLDLRAAGHGAVGAVSDGGALYRAAR